MKYLKILSIIFTLPIIGCLPEKAAAPPKAEGIPAEAVWAGGIDGGAWFLCRKKAGTEDRYVCNVFNDHSGDLWASGEYVIRESSWDAQKGKSTFLQLKVKPDLLEFSTFDGNKIYLKNSLVLLPDGMIDYPFSNGGGKKQLFVIGKKQGEEMEYKNEGP